MSLKSKVILILLCVFVLCGVVEFGIQRFIIFPSFLSLEREEAIKNVRRSVQAIQREIHHLDYLCWDWAAWDDTYEFIESRSDEYIKANLVLATFVDAKLNFIYFVDKNGKIIWSEAHDLETKKIIHLADFPKDTFPANHPLISYKSANIPLADIRIAGVYMTRKGPMLISSRPILNSNNEGPARGSLIIGQFLSNELVKTLADQTQVSFQVFPIKTGSLPEPLKDIPNRITGESRYLVEAGSKDHVESYTTFPDIKGDAAFLIKSKIQRKISEKGFATMRYAMYSVLAAGMGVLIVMLLLLHFSVLGPITDFTNHVMSIGKTGDLSASFPIQRRDEIGILASEFDRMLEQLQKFRAELELKVKERTAELKITNERLHQEIEERKQAEEKLARSTRMESLGLMAGGIAHDLNNILSGVVSYPDLMLMDLSEDSPFRKPLKTIRESGQRAADVVSDLLTIARGVAIGKEVLNLNTIIEEYFSSAEHVKIETLNPSITFKTHLDSALLNTSCSSSHIKKSLLNLVANASEAVEGRGSVVISTMNRYLDESLTGYEDVREGEYAVLSVSDNGPGIFPQDLEKIFEPFYTKKAMGRSGTGLGLAVVWNTVQDHKGHINVKSSEEGTIFELYFPITRDELTAEREQIPFEAYVGHGEMILVVDDQEDQRKIACELLTRLGYRAESVSSGEEAIEYLEKHSVDLIVLDMIMPNGINGRETYERAVKIHPKQKAIIASGFSKTEDVKEAQKLGAGKYIKKPYTLEKIGIAIRDELKK